MDNLQTNAEVTEEPADPEWQCLKFEVFDDTMWEHRNKNEDEIVNPQINEAPDVETRMETNQDARQNNRQNAENQYQQHVEKRVIPCLYVKKRDDKVLMDTLAFLYKKKS